MTLVDAVLIAAAVFVAVSASQAIALYVGVKRQASAAKQRQKPAAPPSESMESAKAAVESFRDKSSAMVEGIQERQISAYERGQRQADRADALYERSEKSHERWEKILDRLEALVKQWEARNRHGQGE